MPRWETGPDHVLWGLIVGVNFFRVLMPRWETALLPWDLLCTPGRFTWEVDNNTQWMNIANTRPNRPSWPIPWKQLRKIPKMAASAPAIDGHHDSLFQPIQAYSIKIQPTPAYSDIFLPIQTYSNLFPEYSRIFHHITPYISIVQPISAYSRPYQPIPAILSLLNPIRV